MCGDDHVFRVINTQNDRMAQRVQKKTNLILNNWVFTKQLDILVANKHIKKRPSSLVTPWRDTCMQFATGKDAEQLTHTHTHR